ncbi:MAG TPA: hypothetical protein DCK87_07275 [Desulfotomaculum sp.]|nr:hypothetical protein [Desulfotomaculum sp.]
MSGETILIKKEGKIAIITLNRPERRNAINRQMMEELITAIEEMSFDEEVRVVMLTGAGKAFCSGADVDLMAGGKEGEVLGEQDVEALRRSYVFVAAKKLILGLRKLEKPTVAVVNGVCVGAGFDLALACDLRLGSQNTTFMCGFVKIGLFPGFGATWLYPRIMGSGKALELLYTGDALSAEDAERVGVLNKIVPAADLDKEALVLAQKIAAGPPIALRLMKAQVYEGLNMDLEMALGHAAMCEAITLASQDHKEGVAALREKRNPNFKGQ